MPLNQQNVCHVNQAITARLMELQKFVQLDIIAKVKLKTMQLTPMLANLAQVTTQMKDNVNLLNAKKVLSQKSQVQKSALTVRPECFATILDSLKSVDQIARKATIVQDTHGSESNPLLKHMCRNHALEDITMIKREA